jgi:hypothetical protein
LTGEDPRALVAEFAAFGEEMRPAALEDAIREVTGRVAYVYVYRAQVTLRLADNAAYRAHAPDLPLSWIVADDRPRRNGRRDYSDAPAAITLAELGHILERDAAGAPYALPALHLRYHDDEADDRYRVVVDTPAGPLEATSLRLYEQFQAM